MGMGDQLDGTPSGSLPFVLFVVYINIVIILFWRINFLASLLVLS